MTNQEHQARGCASYAAVTRPATEWPRQGQRTEQERLAELLAKPTGSFNGTGR